MAIIGGQSVNNPSAYTAPYVQGNNSVPQVTSATLPTVTVTGQLIKPSMKVMIIGGGSLVRFEASAPVSESRVANYEGFNIVHMPTSLWAYRNTNGRHFSISGKLVSRNANEAKANAGYLTTVRSWVLPNFGGTGSTPPIVFLSGYSNTYLTEVPCVVLSYNWTFPEDVDYIYGTTEPMPVIGMLTIEMEEAYSAAQITAGDWQIDAQSGGSFSYAGVPGSASAGGIVAIETHPSYGFDFVGIAGSAATSKTFTSIGNALSKDPSTIAQNPVNENYGNGGTNSPLVTDTSDQIGSGSDNRFISGSSPQYVLNNSVDSSLSAISSLGKYIQPVLGVLDNYARSQGLAIPAIPRI